MSVKEVSWLERTIEGALPTLMEFALSVIAAVLVYVIGVRVVKLVRRLFRRMLERHAVDEGVCQFLDAILKFAGYFIVILMILGLFGVTTASVVAVLGSAGLTLGLALQGSLSNFAGGVLILLLKPFAVGDYIIEGTGKCEGTVKEISVFYTTLATADNLMIVIPNGTLANNSITNLTKGGSRRLDLTVDIGYSSDLRQAKCILERLAADCPYRLQERTAQVVVGELAESSVRLLMQLWTKPEQYWTAKWELNEQVRLAMDEAGIELAFPQLDVHLR